MSNVKQLKDGSGTAFSPKTHIDAITTPSMGGGKLLITNQLGTGVTVSNTNATELVNKTELNQALGTKQNTISDLSDIRSGATAGATAVQPETLVEALNAADIFAGEIDATDSQRNQALANVSNQTANSTTGKMGYVVLQPEKAGDATTTFAAQIANKPNTIFEIRDVFDLGGSTVNLPANTWFDFNGGIVKNGNLSGELYSEKPIDVSSFGLVYNNSSLATTNSGLLTILSNITNEVKLVLSGELYLKTLANGTIAQNYVNIDGCNNIIHTIEFGGFNPKKNTTIRNCKFVGDSNSLIIRYNTTMGENHPSFTFENNVCSGDLSILACKETADSLLTSYFESVKIYNNTFTNIHSTYSGKIFAIDDSNFKNLIFENNSIHNFYGSFLYCGITNSSEYTQYINEFYNKHTRLTIIKQNNVYNDIDYYPWLKYNAVAYFCLALIEAGTCYYEDNSVKNLIDKLRDGETSGDNTAYDVYLSVDILYSRNNIVSNCAKEGRPCELFKSKQTNSGNHEIRYYENNCYSINNLLDLDNNLWTPPAMLFSSMASDELVAINNIFDIYMFRGNGQTNSIKKCVFKDNKFNITNIYPAVDSSQQPIPNLGILHIGVAANEDYTITKNTVKVTNGRSEFGLVYCSSGFTKRLVAEYNKVENCKVIGGDNIVTLSNLIYRFNEISDNNTLYLCDNISTYSSKPKEDISDNKYTVTDMVTAKPYTYRFFNESNSTVKVGTLDSSKIINFRLPDYSATYAYKVMFEIEVVNKGLKYKCEVNLKTEEGQKTLYCIQHDKTVAKLTGTSSSYWYLYNLAENSSVQANTSTDAKRAIKITLNSSRPEIDFTTFSNDNLKITKSYKVVTDITKLENNIIEDNGKLIMWNGTTWVNLDGTPLS